MAEHWTEAETLELLSVRANAEICAQMSGTIRDGAVYDKITQILATRGSNRSKKQVQSKLKCLKMQFSKLNDYPNRGGRDRKYWPYTTLCEAIWGNNPSSVSSLKLGTPTSGESEDKDSGGEEESENQCLQNAEHPSPWKDSGESPAPWKDPEHSTVTPWKMEVVEETAASPAPAVQERRDPERAEVQKRGKAVTKMGLAAQALCASLMDRFERMDKRHAEEEERRAERQRDFERELFEQAQTQQVVLWREMLDSQASLFQQFLSRGVAPPPPLPADSQLPSDLLAPYPSIGDLSKADALSPPWDMAVDPPTAPGCGASDKVTLAPEDVKVTLTGEVTGASVSVTYCCSCRAELPAFLPEAFSVRCSECHQSRKCAKAQGRAKARITVTPPSGAEKRVELSDSLLRSVLGFEREGYCDSDKMEESLLRVERITVVCVNGEPVSAKIQPPHTAGQHGKYNRP